MNIEYKYFQVYNNEYFSHKWVDAVRLLGSQRLLTDFGDLVRPIWAVLPVVAEGGGGQTAGLVHTQELPHPAGVVGRIQSYLAH